MTPFYSEISFFLILIAVVGAAIAMRWWAAPLAAGPDMTQFLAFAKVFQREGFSFYLKAGAIGPDFPYQAWSYNYTPLWLLILSLCLLTTPAAIGTTELLSIDWRIAMKLPLYLSDLLIGFFIFKLVPGSPKRKLFFSALWLLHPTVWYESSVFGQFDSLMTLFLILGLYLLSTKRTNWAFFSFAIAVMIKQHAAVAVLFILLSFWKRWPARERLIATLILGFSGAIISAPFVLSGGLKTYIQFLFVPVSQVSYQEPLIYSFSGLGALLTYIHSTFKIETLGALTILKQLQGLLIFIGAVLSFKNEPKPLHAALMAFLIVLGFSPCVHYQYLIGLIPLALVAASEAQAKTTKGIFLSITLLPAIWLLTFDVGFWFRFMQPHAVDVQNVLKYFGMSGSFLSLPEGFYVAFATTLMLLMWISLGMLSSQQKRREAL